jgi:hypothetical protein
VLVLVKQIGVILSMFTPRGGTLNKPSTEKMVCVHSNHKLSNKIVVFEPTLVVGKSAVIMTYYIDYLNDIESRFFHTYSLHSPRICILCQRLHIRFNISSTKIYETNFSSIFSELKKGVNCKCKDFCNFWTN